MCRHRHCFIAVSPNVTTVSVVQAYTAACPCGPITTSSLRTNPTPPIAVPPPPFTLAAASPTVLHLAAAPSDCSTASCPSGGASGGPQRRGLFAAVAHAFGGRRRGGAAVPGAAAIARGVRAVMTAARGLYGRAVPGAPGPALGVVQAFTQLLAPRKPLEKWCEDYCERELLIESEKFAAATRSSSGHDSEPPIGAYASGQVSLASSVDSQHADADAVVVLIPACQIATAGADAWHILVLSSAVSCSRMTEFGQTEVTVVACVHRAVSPEPHPARTRPLVMLSCKSMHAPTVPAPRCTVRP